MRVIGLAGWSGAGKTTLIVKLIPYFESDAFLSRRSSTRIRLWTSINPTKIPISIARRARARSSSPRPAASRSCMSCAGRANQALPNFCGA
jgi:hypothetical protein